MMQGISVSTLVTPGNSGNYGTVALWRSDLKLMNKIHLNPGIDRQVLRFFLRSPNRSWRRRSRVVAAWLFQGSDKGMDANTERSESANEDILIFFFQLDLATRVQVALNMEQYEIAQQLRNKLTEVETEIIKQREAKRGSTSPKSEAQDKAISILRLRADMQKAIEGENYALAAELRDEISKLEAESLAASAKALAYQNAQFAFRLGQKVRHKIFGYRAVICGMDPVCCESSSWMENANVEKLLRGPNQPFYQVLVDVHADPNLLVTYVPEENLLGVDQPDMERFDHPYISFLFYGMDAAGDFIPIKQLREKYNRPRHEVPLDPHDEEDGEKDT
ncbi:clp protease adapter protein ClpF, chloroplastic [Magnolia sinica]|uniref:clp protease adapter protein ClpF, chloroplastic n=1 Tax=Magnolia sinica TaxID=86752 RepID=UPI00265A43AF|nr:clp protease adapter protein ClpF, chloroplastic [Magnolia sinica]